MHLFFFFFFFVLLAIYYVKERCQDGWFRGVNRSQKTGVFPGNYVTQLRTLNEQSNGQSASGAAGAAIGPMGHSKRSAHGSNAGGGAANITVLSKSGNQNPPDLPPRSSGSSSSSSTSTSVWSKPIGQHVEALFGRKTKTTLPTLYFSLRILLYRFNGISCNQSKKKYFVFRTPLNSDWFLSHHSQKKRRKNKRTHDFRLSFFLYSFSSIFHLHLMHSFCDVFIFIFWIPI